VAAKSKGAEKKDRKKWDRRFMALAHHIADWSKDPNAKVGAVIIDPKTSRVVSTGFNGFPSNVEDSAERLGDKKTKLSMMVHAEQNAILFAGREARGCTIYVVGKAVCSTCAVLIIQSGIKAVKAAKPSPGSERRWDISGRLAVQMFAEAGVAFEDISDGELERLGIGGEDPREVLPPAWELAKEDGS
jgi:dCMP deaminase